MSELESELSGMLLAEEEEPQGPTFNSPLEQELGNMLVTEDQAAEAARRATLYDAVETNPDQYARSRDLGQKSGVPTDVVDRNQKEIERNVRLKEVNALLKEHPKLENMLVDQELAKLAHDDVEQLSEVDRALNLLKVAGGAFMAAGPRIGEAAWAPVRLFGDITGAESIAEYSAAQQRLMRDYQDFWRQPELRAQMELGSTGQGILSGIESSGLAIPGLLATMLTGGTAAPALASIGFTTGGEAYGRARDEGLGTPQSLTYSLLDTIVEVGTERLPLLRLLSDVKVGEPLWKTLGAQIAQETWTEQVATALQDFNEWAYLNPDKPFREYLAERPEAAYQTLVATVTGTTINTGVGYAASRAAGVFGADQQNVVDAEAFQNRVVELSEMAANSKLYQRSPDKFREVVDGLLAENEDADIYINAHEFNQFFQDQGIDPLQVAGELTGVAEQMPEALALNGDLRIKASEYITQIGTSEFQQGLNEIMRAAPEKMSAREAAEWQANQQAEFEQAIAEIEAAHAEDGEFNQSARTVEDQVREQIQATGRFDRQTASKYASLHGAFARVLGHNLGVSPEEAYQRYMLRVTGAPLDAGTQFAQDKNERATAAVEQIRSEGYINPLDPRMVFLGNNATVEVRPFEGAIHLSAIMTLEQGRGDATRALERVKSIANEHGVPVTLTAKPFGTQQGLDQQQLEEWYARHGFESDGFDGMIYVPEGVDAGDLLFQSENSAQEEDALWAAWAPSQTKGGKIRGAPQWVNTNKDLQALYRQLNARIKEGISGRFWYEESAQAVMAMVQGDVVAAEQFIQLLAIYSPQANVQVNTNFAIRAWNQWQNGVAPEDFKVKTAKQDQKAVDVLYNGVPFEGRKTNSFYLNLMHDIVASDPAALDKLQLPTDLVEELNKPVTIDMWMYRAFGYDNEAAGDDKGTGAYSFSENVTRRLTAKLNQKLEAGQERWTPHQVQAAIWTAMKSRYEIPEVKQRTWKRSLEAGLATTNEKGQLQVPATAAGMRKHRALWREEAMKVSSKQATTASELNGASFREFIDQNTRTVTWEAIPTSVLGHSINIANHSLQQAFTAEARGLVIDDSGNDLLAVQLGVPLAWASDGLGAYEGEINPNTLAHLVPTKESGSWSREETQAYARAIQYIFKQDAVPWFRADARALISKKAQEDQKYRVVNPATGKTVPKSKFDTLTEVIEFAEQGGWSREDIRGGSYAFGVNFTFGRDIDTPEAQVLLESLQRTLGEGAGFTRTGIRGITIVNYRDDQTGVPFVDDEVFTRNIEAAKSDLDALGLTESKGVWFEGEYGYEHNWTEDAEGAAILDQDGLAGRPDLQAWARDRRARYEDLLDRYSGRTFFQSGGPEAVPGERGGPAIRSDGRVELTHWSRTRGLEALDPSFHGSGIKGAESSRKKSHPEFWVDRTYYGLNLGMPNGYWKEMGLGPHQYRTSIEPERLYDLEGDPDGLREPGMHPSRVEQAVRDAGYAGYWIEHDSMGMTAAVFETLPTETPAQSPAEVLDDMYTMAGEQKPVFDQIATQIAETLGGRALLPPLKGRARAEEKMRNDYYGDPHGLKDLLRGTVVIPTPDQAQQALELIQSNFEIIGNPRLSLVTGEGNADGYRDLKFNVRVGDTIAELQVNTLEMIVAKELFGHAFYEAARTNEDVSVGDAIDAAQRPIYEEALALAGQGLSPDAVAEDLRPIAEQSADALAQYGFSINVKNASVETRAPFLLASANGNGLVEPSGATENVELESGSTTTGTPSTSNNLALGNLETSNVISTTSDSSLTQRTDNSKARGAINFPPDIARAPSVISLFQNADLSTFLHESGHFFFEVYRDVASQPDAPDQVRLDMDALLRFVGVDSLDQWNAMTDEQRRDGHEKVARAFEAYLFEGNAPSPGLTDLFQTFSSWLVNVYRSLRGLNVNLDPEVRQVFDRMLASEQEIQATETMRRYKPLFESVDQAGMTADAWADYVALGAEATEAAESELQTRSLKDMRWLSNARARKIKELQKEAKAKRAAIRKEVERELVQDPLYAAMRYLSHGDVEPPTNTKKARRLAEALSLGESQKLSKTVLREMYGDGPAVPWRYLSTGKYGVMAQDGAHPNEIAELFGFQSGDELVKKLLAAPAPEQAIESRTDRLAMERHGDLTNPAVIEHAADVAVHNEARLRFLATELKAVNSLLSARAPTGRTDVRGRPLTFNVLDKAAKQYAAQAIGKKTVQEAPKSHQYTIAETRAAKDAERAMRTGDLEQVAIAKRAQLLNAHFFKAANKAGDEIEKMLRYLRKFENDGTRKNIDQGYLDQIDQLLEQFDLKRATQRDVRKRAALKEWLAEQEKTGVVPPIPAAILDKANRQHFSTLTLDELRALRDSVKMVEHAGRLKKKLLTAKDQREFDALMDEAAANIAEKGGKRRPRKLNQETPKEKLRDNINEFFAAHRKLADLFRAMDGYEDGGIMWEILQRPLNAAADKEAAMREAATLHLGDMFGELHKAGKLYQEEYIPEVDMSMSKMQRLMVALNLGNETNRLRLNQGYGWTPEQIHAITNTLTKQDWDFVQGIWDYLNSYWGEIEAKEKRIHGVAPEKVQATPVMTPFGEYKGGYFPIVYDVRQSPRAQKLEAADAAKQAMRGAFARATTRHGHLEQRVEEVKRPLKLSFSVIFNHVDQVIHDLSFHEYLIDQARVLNDKRIEDAIIAYHGPDIYRQLTAGMEAVASGDVESLMAHERAADYLRAGASIAGMGWKLTTGLLQPLGMTQSVARIGPKWVGRGLKKWIGSARHQENSVAWVHEKSTMMRLRAKTLQREINEIRNKIVKESWFREQMDKVAQQFGAERAPDIEGSYFYLIVKLQMVADVPTWIGQYEKSMEAGETEERAIALADQAVLDSQGGGQIKDLAAIQRGNPWFKLWTNFYSYFNVTYNRTREAFAKTNYKSPASIGRLAADVIMLHTVPSALATLLYAVLRGRCGDDLDCLVEQVAEDHLSYSLGMLVGLRELQAMYNGYSYGGPAGARFFAEASKFGQQVGQGEVDEALLRSANQLGGIVFHYPSGQVDYTARGIAALAEGDSDNPAVLLFGPPAKR